MGLTLEQVLFRNKALIDNLRYRWKKELENYGDRQLVGMYNDFFFSDWSGDNDERFLKFVEEYGEDY